MRMEPEEDDDNLTRGEWERVVLAIANLSNIYYSPRNIDINAQASSSSLGQTARLKAGVGVSCLGGSSEGNDRSDGHEMVSWLEE